MRIVFMGTGEIALPTLRWLLDHAEAGGDSLVAVYTQPDKPVGRAQALTPPGVKSLARERGIPVFQPERLRGNDEALAGFASLGPDLAVVMAYGQILPRALLAVPAVACVNLHASLLPRHRGASPVQAAIREGDAESGITLMHVVPKLDAGPMILQRSIPILPEDTGGSLHDRLASLGPEVIEAGLRLFREGRTAGEAQDESLVTSTGKLTREDGTIDWGDRADRIERLVRAYDPWPGTTTTLPVGGECRTLKIFPVVRVIPGGSAPPGTVIEAGSRLSVQCGEGAVELAGGLQLEGRRRMTAAELLRGLDLPAGTVLGPRGTR